MTSSRIGSDAKDNTAQTPAQKLQAEATNATTMDRLLAQLETWVAADIRAAMKEAKGLDLSDEFLEAHRMTVSCLGGKSLTSLANLPTKWKKLTPQKRHDIAYGWPKSRPFFTDVLDLSGACRVDRWRDSHYTRQLAEMMGGARVHADIGHLKGIKELHLESQQLEALPSEIFQLTSLEVLRLQDNEFKALPDELGNLTHLRVLDLTRNHSLKTLPNLGQLENLEELLLEYTKVKSLPDAFFELKHIEKVDTTQCPLDNDTAVIRRLIAAFPDAHIATHARPAIELENNDDDDEFHGEETICFDDINVNTIPNSVFKADAVRDLTINCSSLQELPDRFDELPTLEKLTIDVGENVKHLPASIGTLNKLEELVINLYGITSLPTTFGALSALRRLTLKTPYVESIAPVYELTGLEELSVEGLPLSGFGEGFATLKKLRILHAERIGKNNSLELHPSIREMNLEEVELDLQPEVEVGDDIYHLPPTLKKLKLDYYNGDKRQISLARLLNSFPSLEKIQITGLPLVDDGTEVTVHDALKTVDITVKEVFVPPSIGNLKALDSLTFDNSQFTEFPVSIYDCEMLTFLGVNHARFETIPPGIERLKNLVWLTFNRTEISSLPDGVFELSNLSLLGLGKRGLMKDAAFKKKIKRKIKGLKVTGS